MQICKRLTADQVVANLKEESTIVLANAVPAIASQAAAQQPASKSQPQYLSNLSDASVSGAAAAPAVASNTSSGGTYISNTKSSFKIDPAA